MQVGTLTAFTRLFVGVTPTPVIVIVVSFAFFFRFFFCSAVRLSSKLYCLVKSVNKRPELESLYILPVLDLVGLMHAHIRGRIKPYILNVI